MNLKLNKGVVTQFNFEQVGFVTDSDSCLSITESDEEVYSFLIDVNKGKNEELELPFDLVTFSAYYIALIDTFKTFGQSRRFIKSYSDIKEAVNSLKIEWNSDLRKKAFVTVANEYIKQIDLFLVHIFNDQVLEDLIYHVEPFNNRELLVEFQEASFNEYQITEDIKADPAVRIHFYGSKEVR